MKIEVKSNGWGALLSIVVMWGLCEITELVVKAERNVTGRIRLGHCTAEISSVQHQ